MTRTDRLVLLLLLCLAAPNICLGDSFVWTDTTSGVPGTVYTLIVTPTGPLSYSASLTAQTIALCPTCWPYYIDWIQIKLDQGRNPDLSNLGAPSTNWRIAAKVNDGVKPDFTATVAKVGDIPVDGFSALYVTGILAPATLAGVAQGALLNGTTYNWTFGFAFSSEGFLTDTPSLKVGYYDGFAGRSNNIAFTQMSQKILSEPGGLALFGAGLVLAAGLLHRKGRNRA